MPHDLDYLLDILIAARKVQRFTEGVIWEAFAVDEQLQYAIVKLIEIAGEAAGKITPPMRDAHPEIPWRDMINMRNRLIHEYARINLAIVWDVVQNDVPRLISFIEPLVPPEEAD
jgi:uncharacterized protein with HEPN domain